jgi:hypothetical protein
MSQAGSVARRLRPERRPGVQGRSPTLRIRFLIYNPLVTHKNIWQHSCKHFTKIVKVVIVWCPWFFLSHWRVFYIKSGCLCLVWSYSLSVFPCPSLTNIRENLIFEFYITKKFNCYETSEINTTSKCSHSRHSMIRLILFGVRRGECNWRTALGRDRRG